MDADKYPIRTGLYGEKALEVLKALKPMVKTTGGRNTKFYVILKMSTIERMPDNEIVFVRPKKVKLHFYDTVDRSMPDADFLQRFAWKIKEFVYSRGYSSSWRRDCTDKVTINYYLRSQTYTATAAIGDMYFIYDHFLNRRHLESKYGKAKCDEFVGKPLDPIMTEMKIAQLEEIKKLNADFDAWLASQAKACEVEIQAASKAIYAKYSQIQDEHKLEIESKIQKIRDSIAALTSST